MNNIFIKSGIFLMTRSLIVFVLIYAAVSFFINHQKMRVADRTKISFYTHPDAFKPLVDSFNNDQPLSQEHYREYVYYFEDRLKKNAQAYDAMHVLGYVYARQGELQRAQELFEKIAGGSSQNIWAYFNLGAIAFQSENTYQAIKYFQKIVMTTPESAMGFFKDSLNVLQPLMHAAAMTPNDLRRRIKSLYRESYLGIVVCYERLNDQKSVFQAAELALNANVGHKGDFYYYAGRAKYLLGEYTIAENLLKEAVRARTDDPNALMYLKMTLEAVNKKDEVAAAGKKLIELQKLNIPSDGPENKIGLRLY